MTEISYDFLDEAFQDYNMTFENNNNNMYNTNTTSTTNNSFNGNNTAENSLKKSKKSSKNKEDSLERPKKKKEKGSIKEIDFSQPQQQQQQQPENHQDAYMISLGIMESGDIENSSKWVKSNSKKLAELFSIPLDSINIADQPKLSHASNTNTSTSTSKKSVSKKDSKLLPEMEVVPVQEKESSKSKSSKSSKSSTSTKKSHKSSSSSSAATPVVATPIDLLPQHIPMQPVQQPQPQPQEYETPTSIFDEEDTESKRQNHLQSEQTRRKHIKNGLEELKNSLPSCENQKLTKAAILNKAIHFVQQSKRQKEYLSNQVNLLRQELQSLKHSCKCGQSQDCSNIHHNQTLLKQQDKLCEYTPIQPKSKVSPQIKSLKPFPQSSFVQQQQHIGQEAPPPYSLPNYTNMLSVPDMRFRNPSPASSIDGDSSDSRSFNDESSDSLPMGWEEIITPDGKMFYINKLAGVSSWVDPRQNKAINVKQTKQSSKGFQQQQQQPQQQQFQFQFQPQFQQPQYDMNFSPEWESLPDFVLPDISAIQFGQVIDANMSEVKRPSGLGVDMQCFSN